MRDPLGGNSTVPCCQYRRFSIAAVALGLGACGGSLTPSQYAERAAGCYYLQSHMHFESLFAGFVPSAFQLDTTPLISRHVRIRLMAQSDTAAVLLMRIEPQNPHITYGLGGPYWKLLDRDSLYINWGSGVGGVAMQLRYSKDTLTGVSTPYTDLPESTPPRISTIAVRIRCPATMLSWADAQ
jgi:hypothetical protein